MSSTHHQVDITVPPNNQTFNVEVCDLIELDMGATCPVKTSTTFAGILSSGWGLMRGEVWGNQTRASPSAAHLTDKTTSVATVRGHRLGLRVGLRAEIRVRFQAKDRG